MVYHSGWWTFDFFSTSLSGSTLTPCKHPIRVVIIDGAPWFVAVDVCKVLGILQPSHAYRRLAEHSLRTINRTNLGLTKGGKPMLLLSEGAFYDLVARSDKPVARAFQLWVNEEVLPAIRRTGGYRLQGVAPEAVEEQDRSSR